MRIQMAQKQKLRDIEALYAEKYDAYTIVNTLYQSWLDVYNFLRIQPPEASYANAYNVHTGAVIEHKMDDTLYSAFHELSKYRVRFGTPGVQLNYFYLAGIFNDEKMLNECSDLTQAIYLMHLYYFQSQPDMKNPDIYADNGFNLWGYDSYKICAYRFDACGKSDPASAYYVRNRPESRKLAGFCNA